MSLLVLPIDDLLPEILATLRTSSNLILEAAPGAGKTTRVPPALLSLVPGHILVLEPRRIAARLAARRVAAELGEQAGETVGYQVRFEEVSGPRTRLRFLTEGVLTRRLLSDPELRGVDCVILDEFHERHLDTDLALALLRRLQHSRPELKLVVMSATLHSEPIAKFLGGCPVLRSEGRVFPLTIQHLPYSSAPLHEQVRDAVDLMLREKHAGDILAFLPGAAEIRRAQSACSGFTNLLVLPLHGDLPPAEQDRAIAPASQRKLILATNLAESSITVPGVTAVIDSGLARIASHSPWTGLPTLTVGRISKASATQRAGRAARTAPGRVLRLFPEEDLRRRPDHDTPEILRADLSQLCLSLRVLGIRDLEWLDPPPANALEQAESLLDRLGASGEMLAELARYPLHPRIARLLIESIRRNVAEDGIRAAAFLSSGARSDRQDLLAALDLPPDPRTQQIVQQLRRLVRAPKQASHHDDDLLIALLTGFPDRVAKMVTANQAKLVSGVSVEVSGATSLPALFLALDAEDRSDKPLPLVRLIARIEPEWLLDLYPEQVSDESTLLWNAAAERVESVETLRYGQVILEETRHHRASVAASRLLAEKALENGPEHFAQRFSDLEAFQNLLARIEFAELPAPALEPIVQELADGLRSFSELKSAAANLLPLIEYNYPHLNQLAPASLRLQAGRQTRIHYERGKPPWIASRLQDFFGMQETPRIGPHRTPVTIQLLAPNQRPVQTTTDLAGFWQRLYPQVRRELMRRYPRHQWPEKP